MTIQARHLGSRLLLILALAAALLTGIVAVQWATRQRNVRMHSSPAPNRQYCWQQFQAVIAAAATIAKSFHVAHGALKRIQFRPRYFHQLISVRSQG